MILRRRRTLSQKVADQVGNLVDSADGKAAKGGLAAVGGALALTALSSVVSVLRRRESQ